MPAREREWSREPLPAERIDPGKPKISDDDLADWRLTDDGDGFRFEKDPSFQLGWGDVLFWAVLLILARLFT